MLLSAVSLLVVAQSSSEIPEGLMNNRVVQPSRLVSNLTLHFKCEVDTEISLQLGCLCTLISVYKWTLLGSCATHMYRNIMHEGRKNGL